MRVLFIILGLFITSSVSAKEEQPSYVKGELLCQLHHFDDTAEIQVGQDFRQKYSGPIYTSGMKAWAKNGDMISL